MATGVPIPKPKKLHRKSVAQQWFRVRARWLKDNPPPIDGCYYRCALCGGTIYAEYVTLDHIQTRSSRPDLRLEPSNLQPAHGKCNLARGSMSMEAWNNREIK